MSLSFHIFISRINYIDISHVQFFLKRENHNVKTLVASLVGLSSTYLASHSAVPFRLGHHGAPRIYGLVHVDRVVPVLILGACQNTMLHYVLNMYGTYIPSTVLKLHHVLNAIFMIHIFHLQCFDIKLSE